MHKRIVLSLSEKSLDSAIRQVEGIAESESKRIDDVCRQYAEAIRKRAQEYFNEAWLDSVGKRGERRDANVEVRMEKADNGYKVIASGEDTVWVEFGAGVFFNGPSGQSPHPKGQELGFLIGGYGKGKGSQNAWGFYNEDGELIITRGTEAQMPLYRAFSEILQEGLS